MSLISCPECKKTISDRANHCPYCGYPLSDGVTNDSKYDIFFIAFSSDQNLKLQTIKYFREALGLSLSEVMRLAKEAPCIMFNNVSTANLNQIQHTLSRLQCKIKITLHEGSDSVSDDTMIENYYAEDNRPKCPTCGSDDIEKLSITNRAIHGAVFGLFSATAKSQMRCRHCGYKW